MLSGIAVMRLCSVIRYCGNEVMLCYQVLR